MKTIEIIGDNYFGRWDKTRMACRGIIVENGRILLSYETAGNVWMIPGGGLEDGESERDCCARELAEETGLLIRPSPCVLEIGEYYEDCRYVSRYFFGEVVGRTERKLTAAEREAGLEPRWLPVDEALAIFSRHADYADADEMQRGLYLREYTALRELFSVPGDDAEERKDAVDETKLIDNMIRWAESRLDSPDYAGWCLNFIEDALERGNGIEIFGGDSAKESSELYRDALRGGEPEKGAFVFYDCLCPDRDRIINWGHCGISLGGGRVIHAWDRVRIDDYLAIEKLTALTRDHPKYLGWVPLERVLNQK